MLFLPSRITRLAALFILASVILACSPVSVLAQASQAAKPRLVLLIVADHFSYNYLSRYQDKLSSGGFRFLTEHGANFTNCRLQNATAQNAVGQAAISSGANPWLNGIVGDEWYYHRAKTVSAVADDSARLVGANGPGASPHRLMATTIGDQMKLATNGRSKVISLSLRDSSAIILGGALANYALWFDTRTGGMVSSSQYGSDLPGWVKTFNDQHYADKYFGKPWQRSLPESEYTASTRDDYPHETMLQGDGRQFPHVITGGATAPGEAYYNRFVMTPFANQMIGDLARDAIEREYLGQHPETDLLAVSFSAGDYLNSAFGPYSQEAEDLVIKLDQTLSTLFQHVDRRVGLNNCLIVFTAAHSTLPIPEFLKERRLNAGRIDPKSFMTLLDSALDSRLGPDDWIEAFEPPNLYLNFEAMDKQKIRQPDLEGLAASLARTIAGIQEVVASHQLLLNQVPSSALTDAIRKSYYWKRSGELFVVPRPGFVFSSQTSGTASGSPYGYDTQVPLIMYGASVRGGRYTETVSPTDIAPTIAAVLGIEAPSLCEGSALSQALAQLHGPPAPRLAPAQPEAPLKSR